MEWVIDKLSGVWKTRNYGIIRHMVFIPWPHNDEEPHQEIMRNVYLLVVQLVSTYNISYCR